MCIRDRQYPLAKLVLAGVKENSQHLPQEIEQFIMQNPQLLQQLIAIGQETAAVSGGTNGHGGARPNSGPEGNGATHAANVERTNERNRAANSQVSEGLRSTPTGGV